MKNIIIIFAILVLTYSATIEGEKASEVELEEPAWQYSKSKNGQDEEVHIRFALEEPKDVPTLPGGWTRIDVDEVTTDPDLQMILSIGVTEVLKAGIKDGLLPPEANNYSLLTINKAQYQIVNGKNYDFDVAIGDGEHKVTITFTLWEKPSKDRKVTKGCFRAERLVRV